MLDTLGVMLAGGAHPSVRALAAAAARGEGRAALATGGRADAEAAALVNGAAAHVWDFDDTSYTGIMHGSAVVLPAGMALAQEVGSGAGALRRAFVAGFRGRLRPRRPLHARSLLPGLVEHGHIGPHGRDRRRRISLGTR